MRIRFETAKAREGVVDTFQTVCFLIENSIVECRCEQCDVGGLLLWSPSFDKVTGGRSHACGPLVIPDSSDSVFISIQLGDGNR